MKNNFEKAIYGFCLNKLEVVNFGTWDGNNTVHTFYVNNDFALLTGTSGSGKSSLIDAIITLLVPSKEIIYNKAADSIKNERTLESYVYGYYSSVSSGFNETKPLSLRDKGFLSLILGHFYDTIRKRHVSLCQILYPSELNSKKIDRLFIVSNKELSLKDHFSNLGTNIKEIKRTLKQRGFEIIREYKDYRTTMMRSLGIYTSNAISLFNMTVSQKKVPDISKFIKEFMLSYVDLKVYDIIDNYRHINSIYNEIERAQDKIKILTPLKKSYQEYQDLKLILNKYEKALILVRFFLGKKAEPILINDIQNSKLKLDSLIEDEALKNQEKNEKSKTKDQVFLEMNSLGGNRLIELKKNLDDLKDKRVHIARSYREYLDNSKKIGITSCDNKDIFISIKNSLPKKKNEFEANILDLEAKRDDLNLNLRDLYKDIREHEDELNILKAYRSNIDIQKLNIRQNIANALNIDIKDLPFVGELMKVKDEYSALNASIESLLHDFAISILVDANLEERFIHALQDQKYKNKISYFVVGQITNNNFNKDPSHLFSALLFKNDKGRFENFIKEQLISKFDFYFVKNYEDFYNRERAILVNGDVKYDLVSYSKDFNVANKDNRSYVLGWSNENKIKTLESLINDLKVQVTNIKTKENQIKYNLDSLRSYIQSILFLMRYESFSDIDVFYIDNKIKDFENEIYEIENSNKNDYIRLKDQFEKLEKDIKDIDKELNQILISKGSAQQNYNSYINILDELKNSISNILESEIKEIFPFIEETLDKTILDKLNSTEHYTAGIFSNLKEKSKDFYIQKVFDTNEKVSNLTSEIKNCTIAYQTKYKEDCVNVIAEEVEYVPYFLSLLKKIEDDTLVHDKTFRLKLKQDNIEAIGLFEHNIEEQEKAIQTKIKNINKILVNIDFDEKHYIEIVCEPTRDSEILKFRSDLKSCTENYLSDGDSEDEIHARFLKLKDFVKSLDLAGDDKHKKDYTDKVTDVRNSFVYSIRKCDKVNHEEVERQTSTSGKSGGEKEKISFAILSTALAYQYNQIDSINYDVDNVTTLSKKSSFRLVIIDEAFANVSNDAIEFALKLFRLLNMQLIVITPNQKITTIEKFVTTIGIVFKDLNNRSQIVNFTFDERQELLSRLRDIEAKKLSEKETLSLVGDELYNVVNSKVKKDEGSTNNTENKGNDFNSLFREFEEQESRNKSLDEISLNSNKNTLSHDFIEDSTTRSNTDKLSIQEDMANKDDIDKN